MRLARRSRTTECGRGPGRRSCPSTRTGWTCGSSPSSTSWSSSSCTSCPDWFA